MIKAADPDTKFAWHQDSGYVHEDHQPYLTCWIALDDVNEENGAVYILPYGRSGIRSYVKHIKADTGDQVGYFGSDVGMPVTAPAGSIVCFSSLVFHRSGANLTDQFRREYLLQYSPEVIMDKAGTKPWAPSSSSLTRARWSLTSVQDVHALLAARDHVMASRQLRPRSSMIAAGSSPARTRRCRTGPATFWNGG